MNEEICECGHGKSKHCKAGTFHSNYKDAMRMVPKPRGSHCSSDHCNAALCCYTQFRPKEEL